ncbi:MAG TPA: wax ester/triacylglycerol synthase family O-acyltransferase [Nevskiaceae bacterium]|nr:wax ester/triacylglycerol synthase family O-acyltransferase [Nevskiaceae bacterium]
MRRLTPLDSLFLLLERRQQPLHVGALCLFHPPPGSGPDIGRELAERLRASSRAAAPFNRRLVRRLGLSFWEDDAEFDLAHHFVHLALPRPGKVRDLLAMISRVHSAHLDRAYPLWRTYLIEGLEDGRIAQYSKIHHALVDGVAGIRLMMKSMSASREDSLSMPPPWEVRTRKTRTPSLPVPAPAVGGAGALRGLWQEGLNTLPGVWGALRETWHDLRAQHPDLVTSLQAPRCVLNRPITGSRRFAAQSYSSARIKAVARAVEGTANDGVLALCGGALRRYLGELGELPDRPLIAGVPVSLRRDEGDSGNEIAFALCTLATDQADPLERLRRVKACMDYNKTRMRSLSSAQLMAYGAAMLLPGALNLLSGFGRTTALNVVISHVPGPRQPQYWQGCELDGLYPVSLVMDGVALNITLVSRHDQIDFGLVGCRKTLPHLQRLLDHLDAELLALEQALGQSAERDRLAASAA